MEGLTETGRAALQRQTDDGRTSDALDRPSRQHQHSRFRNDDERYRRLYVRRHHSDLADWTIVVIDNFYAADSVLVVVAAGAYRIFGEVLQLVDRRVPARASPHPRRQSAQERHCNANKLCSRQHDCPAHLVFLTTREPTAGSHTCAEFVIQRNIYRIASLSSIGFRQASRCRETKLCCTSPASGSGSCAGPATWLP